MVDIVAVVVAVAADESDVVEEVVADDGNVAEVLGAGLAHAVDGESVGHFHVENWEVEASGFDDVVKTVHVALKKYI